MERGIDVGEKDIPEGWPENCSLKHHIRKSEGSGERSVYEDCGCSGREIICKKIHEGGVEASLAKFM